MVSLVRAVGLLIVGGRTCTATDGLLANSLHSAVQNVAREMHKKYDMSVAAALHSPQVEFAVAAGFTDRGLGMGTAKRLALPDDDYVWGSTTKMYTAPAVLQLVERGVVSLDDPVAKHVDPILKHLNGTTLTQLFGHAIDKVLVRHVLHMVSGVADYDNGNYSLAQFANRTRAISPVEIIVKYVNPKLLPPAAKQSYSSTNYILLGLILANHYHKDGTTWSWQGYDQASVIPEALKKAFPQTRFALQGPCSAHTPVHGFMEAYPTAPLAPQDVWNVSCLGGWTAGNIIAPVIEVARFTYDLYNTKMPRIVSAASQALMTNFSVSSGSQLWKFYGMGTFSLDWSVGGGTTAYGHVGDTYGYQSQTTYIPEMDLVLTVATNVETKTQAQPADFTCSAYNAIAAILRGQPRPKCKFTVFGRFVGACSCSYDDAIVV